MKYTFLALLFFGSALTFAEDLLTEPPLKLTVSVGGKEVEVTPGEAAQLAGEFKDPEIKVTLAPVRSFRRMGMAFDYPVAYNWEADGDEEVPTWTMEGPNVTIVLSHSMEEVSAADLAEEQRKTHGGDAVRKPSTETHGGREFKGWKVEATLSGTFITVHCFVMDGKKGQWMLQLVDSGCTRDGEPSDEFKSTMELLGRTMKTGAP